MGLPTVDLQKYVAAQENTLQLLGVPAVWHQAKQPQASKPCTVGFKTASWNDEELSNAYGIGAKVFTISVKDVPVLEKFDRLVIGNERYTLDAALPVHVNGVLVFWKGICKGD